MSTPVERDKRERTRRGRSGMDEGRAMFQADRGKRGQTEQDPPLNIEAIRRSGIAEGRALFRASRGDRTAREALNALAAEQIDPTPPAA
jgi:hypothetical protein